MDDGRSIPAWNGRRSQDALAQVKARGKANNLPCCICEQPIDYDIPSSDPDGCSVQHPKSRALYPHLTWDPLNWAPEHLTCNKGEGTAATLAIGTTSRVW
ncbi:HNH endonuclease [Nesterenkonia haasae]|uniref:HNH endonuclease n=1 Tax=Nesterenkonia haasae TaxID=2587813 RepID=UPI001391B383|nr:HNH endonuclease [Nesterenkonia haasae]NDK30201.1 HNH endonuclease [Nesterenkonia haasae]